MLHLLIPPKNYYLFTLSRFSKQNTVCYYIIPRTCIFFMFSREVYTDNNMYVGIFLWVLIAGLQSSKLVNAKTFETVWLTVINFPMCMGGSRISVIAFLSLAKLSLFLRKIGINLDECSLKILLSVLRMNSVVY